MMTIQEIARKLRLVLQILFLYVQMTHMVLIVKPLEEFEYDPDVDFKDSTVEFDGIF